MKVLSLSDVVVSLIYSPQVKSRFSDIDFVLGCGDLPYYYLEYVMTMLDIPLYYVRGNHANVVEYSSSGTKTAPLGGIDLHCRKSMYKKKLLLAGVEGSNRYRNGPFQYSQNEMWENVFRLLPGLFINKLVHGRYIDVFVSHAPPDGIHDQQDLAHRGIKAFLWLLKVFKPTYHFHGHIHVYNLSTITKTQFRASTVINTYGFRETFLDIPALKAQ